MSDFNFKKLAGRPLTQLAHLILVENPPHHPSGDFEILKGGFLSYSNKNSTTKNTFSGIGSYSTKLFDNLTPGRFKLAPLLKSKMDTNQISGEFYNGTWIDVGTAERLQQARQHLSL